MGIAGYIIGGALQGLGQGMALKQKSEDEDRRAELAERRALALENTRSQNMAGREEAQAKRQEDASARNDQRDLSNKLTIMGKSAEYETSIAGQQAASANAQSDKEFKQKLALLDAETNAKIREFNSTYRDEISNIERDEVTGEATGITKTGKKVPLGKIARKLPKASATSELLDDDYVPGQGPIKGPIKPPPGFVIQD